MFGPCSAESEKQVLETAKAIKKYFNQNLFRAGIWKPRTRPGSFEGAGIEALNWLQSVKQETGFHVATEVANTAHVEACLKAGIDVIWIGARTTVNPFQVQEIADALQGSGVGVMVKNPINPDINLWLGAIERIQKAEIEHVAAIHRGFQSSEQSVYRYPPHWHMAIEFKRQRNDIPIITDCSHIAGTPELIPVIAQKSMDLAMDGLMIETHINPAVALSDAKQQITPAILFEMVNQLLIRQTNSADDQLVTTLETIRALIDDADDQMIRSLLHRVELVNQIGHFKKDKNITIFQVERWKAIFDRQLQFAKETGINEGFVEKLYTLIHEESIRIQNEIFNHNHSKSK
jgi:chorismate mutase